MSLSFSSFLLEFRVSRKSRASSVSFFYLLSFIGIFRDESHFRRRARARDASMGRGDALIAAAVAGYLFHFLMLREWFPSPLAPIGPHTHTRRERERERERNSGRFANTYTHIAVSSHLVRRTCSNLFRPTYLFALSRIYAQSRAARFYNAMNASTCVHARRL